MTATKRIAILTGGGDVPGLNAVIKSVVYRATEAGYDVIGIRRGWEGLTHVRPGDPSSIRRYLRLLDRTNTRTIERTGGTILHTSRTNPRTDALGRAARLDGRAGPGALRDRRRPVRPDAAACSTTSSALGIDVLVTIGGDDTLSYSQVLVNAGVPLVAIPKTMDNDVQGTEYCIGFSTAITRAKEAINRQRTTLGSHERIGVFRIFGRDAGFSALYTAYVTSARCVIPEAPYDLDALAALLKADHDANPSRYAFVITAEGAIWQGAQMSDVGERGRIRPSPQGERRRGAGVRAARADRDRDARVGADLRPPERRAGLDRFDGGDDVRERRDGPRRGRRRPDGWSRSRTASTPTLALPDPALGPRKVDVPVMYNVERFRPRYDGKLGDPMLLVGLD